jgi:NhaA family Na+:H+ antiporter
MLPIAGAIGGMLVPAVIYAAFNGGREGEAGWGIPMATDIAFALGILGLMGKRIASWLPVFLAALAIADDLGAVIVIAMFYTAAISWTSLVVAALVLGLLVLLNRLGVRSTLPYALLGIVVWLAMLHSGIHATIAGVLVAMTIPARTRIDGDEFVTRGHLLLGEFDRVRASLTEKERSDDQDAVVHALEISCDQVQTPLGRMEHGLTMWISFFILPLFAFANAGVALSGDAGAMLANRVTLGIAVALPFGKALGISLFCWLAVRLKLGALPEGARWRQLRGAAWLGGIGFTMSLFIAGLAFTDGAQLGQAKIGILSGSLLAGVIGWRLLRRESGA